MPIQDEDGATTGWRRNIYAVPPHGSSDGGAFATAWDLVDFLQALRKGKLLSEDLTQKMITPAGAIMKEGGKTWCYGYGMAFIMDVAEVLRYGHGGDDPGISAKVAHYPKQEIDLVILGNQTGCAEAPIELINDIIINH